MTASKLSEPTYPYTVEELDHAATVWGCCNCGPAALATMVNLKPLDVLPLLPQFRERRYTNPTMMKDALDLMGVPWRKVERVTYGLCRIQWEGPWSAPDMNPRWAYGYTHWIGAMVWQGSPYVFDVNSGWTTELRWVKEIVPQLTGTIKRASGGWHATHHWELWPALAAVNDPSSATGESRRCASTNTTNVNGSLPFAAAHG